MSKKENTQKDVIETNVFEDTAADVASADVAEAENAVRESRPEDKSVADGKDNKTKSAPCGKFRTPEELLRAYGELEKEFTRRSQRLAEAERQLAEKDAPFNPSAEEWKSAVDKFFADIPAAKPFAKEMAKEIISHPELKADRNCLNNALVRVLAASFRTPEQLVSDGQFLRDYVLTSTAVKAAVVDGYLKGLRAGQPPVVMRDGGQFGMTPRKAPKSIEEAGTLFLKENE